MYRRSLMCRSPWLLAAFLFLVAAPRAEAQDPGLTITILGGYSVDGDLIPVEDGVSNVNTVLEPGMVTAIQLEHYPWTGLFGFRLAGLYAARSLDDDSGEYDVWGADLGMMLRPRLGVDALRPYLVLTLGATLYTAHQGWPPIGRWELGPDPVLRPHTIVGLGLDVSIIPQLGLRVEGGDRVTFPSVGPSPEIQSGFPTTHAPIVMLGLQYRLGAAARRPRPRPRPAVQAPEPEPTPVAEEPAPEPEPTPEPEAAPEAPPRPAPEPEPAEAPAPDAVFTVQVGTFLTQGTARRWGERLTARGLPVWYLDRELGGMDVSRVRAGAVATEAEAQRLAAIIQRSFGWDTSVERIGPDDAVPAGAVVQTREFLGGQ